MSSTNRKCDSNCPPATCPKFPSCFQYYPGSSQKKNPGNIEELHLLARRIQPVFMDGLELEWHHRLAVNKSITHNWTLSHIRPGGYRLGGIYYMNVQHDVLQTPRIHADINPTTMTSNVGILYYPFKCLRFQADVQRVSTEEALNSKITAELIRPCTNVMLNLYDITSDIGRGTLSVMRALTDHWAIGAELLFEWTEPLDMMADVAFAARYSHYNYSIAASAGRQGLDVSYWQRINPKIQMASSLAWNRKSEASIGSVYYQYDFYDSSIRGLINSDFSLGFTYYRLLPHVPCGLTMGLLLNLPTNRFVFGLKLNLDPSGLRRGD